MLRTAPFSDAGWAGTWTIFYWGWWISWASFNGKVDTNTSPFQVLEGFPLGVITSVLAIFVVFFFITSSVSATLAGFDPSATRADSDSTDHEVFEIHVVPSGALKMDPATGAWDIAETPSGADPLGGEVFDSPEFEESAEGQARVNGEDDTLKE